MYLRRIVSRNPPSENSPNRLETGTHRSPFNEKERLEGDVLLDSWDPRLRTTDGESFEMCL